MKASVPTSLVIRFGSDEDYTCEVFPGIW